MTEKISHSLIKELLYYDEKEGQLYWKIRGQHLFSPTIKTKQQSANAWNARYAKTKALSSEVGDGYRSGCINIDNKKYRISHHRAVWFLNYGYWPNNIDHIDHNKENDKLENLRDVTPLENSQNVSMHKTNKSGITGISHRLVNGEWNGKWRAIVWNNRKRKYLGDFTSKEEAIKARENFLSSVNTYHPNHGK